MVRVKEGFGCKVTITPARLRFLFIIATVFGGILIISLRNGLDKVKLTTKFTSIATMSNYEEFENFTEAYTIKTKGCTIPRIIPFGEEVKQFVKFPKEINACPDSNISLLDNNRTHIWVRNENKKHYNVTSDTVFKCCYASFHRPLAVKDVTSSKIDNRVYYNTCNYFSDIIQANNEFVRVSCKANETEIYQQYFLFTFKKPFNSDDSGEIFDNTSYNVIVMGIDTVSRLNFHRTMPETLSILKKKGAVELLGYNKVGDNTFPNLIPMLMGISEKQLKTTCLPNKKSTFDNCPFIWNWFKEAGYNTAFGEDSSSIGTFNYQRVGFIGKPTDYYIHTFINEAEHNVGRNKDLNAFLCMNNKYFYAVLLDYIESLTTTLKSKILFGFFWETTITHDFVNYPMLIDKDYANFLKKLDSKNYLDNTILFLVSDHGMRWGNIRKTNQGRLEERLPFVYIIIPPKFRNKHTEAYKNLNLNRHRLTTPYDIHATLFDLINLKTIENDMIDIRQKQLNVRNKGISLFLPISSNRTCEMAHIEDHWCSCHKGHQLSSKSEQSLNIAEILVVKLNNLLKQFSQCAILKLNELLDIVKLDISSPENDKMEWSEYIIVIKTTPGAGLFEGTIRYTGQMWSLIGTISRLNLYGNQSHCIDNPMLKLYCYCI